MIIEQQIYTNYVKTNKKSKKKKEQTKKNKNMQAVEGLMIEQYVLTLESLEKEVENKTSSLEKNPKLH